MLVDTHCHIHEPTYEAAEDAYKRAQRQGVSTIICVGTDGATSAQAKKFAERYEHAWCSVGVHPHESMHGVADIARLAQEGSKKLVAVGEIGLDYFYTHSPRQIQIEAFEAQLQIALEYQLPVIFHVREAFTDFWPIYSNFPGLRGVLHSFTDSQANMDRALTEGLYIGLNGISTFTKDAAQSDMFDMVPLERMVLETDAPFLTPAPHRGKVNEPAFVRYVAEYHANRRGVELETIARVTSANASHLFSFS